MNSVQQPGASTRPHDRLADDLDGMLRSFFRAEVPEPWPDFQLPVMSSLHENVRSYGTSRYYAAGSRWLPRS